jgi:hypothetical protein
MKYRFCHLVHLLSTHNNNYRIAIICGHSNFLNIPERLAASNFILLLKQLMSIRDYFPREVNLKQITRWTGPITSAIKMNSLTA